MNAAERLQVIGIAVDRLPDVQAFVTETGITYPILVGQQEAMDAAELFGPDFIGTAVLQCSSPATARCSACGTGELDPAELRELLEVLDAVGAGNLDVAAARQRMLAAG